MFYAYSVGLVIIVLSIVRADITENENIKFLIADERGICAIDDITHEHTLILEASGISSFDYHAQKNLLFYNNDKTNSIYSRQLFNKSADSKLIISNSQRWNPSSLAVDFINDKLYVLDKHTATIDIFNLDVTDLDGNNHAIVVGLSLKEPSKIILDPYSGLLFLNNFSNLERINMDGTEPKLLFEKARIFAFEAYGFDVNLDEKQLFWANHSTHTVFSLDYDGNKLNKLLIDDTLDFSSLAFSYVEKRIYLLYNSTLETIVLNNGKVISRTLANVPMIKDPKIIKPYIKRPLSKISNPCLEHNGGCQQICTLKPNDDKGLGRSCGCKPGYNLLPNLTSCEPVSDFILLPHDFNIKSYNLYSSSINFNQAMFPIAPKGRQWAHFSGLGCDVHEQQIYFNTGGEECLQRIRMNDSVQGTLFCGGNPSMSDLSFDWVSKNIYYTSFEADDKGQLQVINPRSTSKIKTILMSLSKPEKLVVHPNKGYIFFLERYYSPDYASIINRVNTDGTDLKQLNSLEESTVEYLAIDFKDDKLYWIDNGAEDEIKYMDFDGTNIKTLNWKRKIRDYPNAIDIYRDHLFISLNHQQIIRVDKVNGDLSKDFRGEVQDRNLLGIKVCDKTAQKLMGMINPCLENNGGCEDFCFAVPKNISDSDSSGELMRVCGCSDDRKLVENGTNCVRKYYVNLN